VTRARSVAPQLDDGTAFRHLWGPSDAPAPCLSRPSDRAIVAPEEIYGARADAPEVGADDQIGRYAAGTIG
jgi:hypothetical protein